MPGIGPKSNCALLRLRLHTRRPAVRYSSASMRLVDRASDRRATTGRARICATLIAAALVFLGLSRPAIAWVYPEHRALAVLAVIRLDDDRRVVFEQLWAEARAG